MTKLLAAVSGILSYLVGTAVYAQGEVLTTWLPSNNFKIQDLPDLIQFIVLWLLIFSGVVAVIYIIWGGYSYITAGGDAEKAGAGRTTLVNAIIGLIIIFSAYAIVLWLGNQLGQA
jgi:hypothetical protein